MFSSIFVRSALFSATVLGCAALFEPDPARSEEITVKMMGGPLRFEPAQIEIKSGDTVRWVNAHNRDHTVTPKAGSEGLKGKDLVQPMEEYAETIEGEARTINYECSIHPVMQGVITVAGQ